MAYGVLPEGFIIKTYNDIIEEKKTYAKQFFGTDVDLNSTSPLMKFIEVITFEEALLWENLQSAYYSAYVDTATGSSLDSVVAVMGITRIPATKATGTLTITGSPGTDIPADWTVQTEAGTQFVTDEACEIGAGGTVDVSITAVKAGSDGNVNATTINTIISAISGVTSISNAAATEGGIDEESDAALRYRAKTALSVAGRGTVASIVAAVNSVSGVESVSYDEDLTTHTLSLVVAGNFAAEDVDKAILDTRPAGIEVTWQEPKVIDIYVDITVSLSDDHPTDVLDTIDSEIDSYINALGAGEDVLFYGIIDVVMDIAGVEDVTDLQVSTNPPPVLGTTNISISTDEIASTDTNKISVGGV